MKQQICALICSLVLAIGPAGLVPTASADPAAEPAPAGLQTVALTDLGSERDVLFYGQIGTETLTIPVPRGMTPATLNAVTQLPVNVSSGTLTVIQDDRVLARVEVPPVPGPVVLPLQGARVEENAVSVLLRSYLLPVDGYCLDPTNPLRLTEASVSFTGRETEPTVVADFLPPVLRRAVIHLGAQPTNAESDAAVKLATALAARYRGQNPEIFVRRWDRNQPPAVSTAPFERHLVIAEGSDPGVSLYGDPAAPALLIAGPAHELMNQTRLLTSNLGRFALSSKAVAGPLNVTPQLPGNETTLRKLGQPGVNATALNPQVGISLDQTRLGRSAHDLRVHLQGSYTPLPGDIGGQLVASVGNETIDRWPATPDGVVDRWVDVPDRLLQRFTTLAVQVNISGNTGRCGEFQPITLTIDGETVVTSRPARPPVPKGFQSLPQALMPRVLVGINDDTFGDTVRAVAIMTGLQRLSALPIDTAVVPVGEALDAAGPAVLISPDGWDHPDIELPIREPDTVPTTIDGFDDAGEPTTVTLVPELRFASLQTVYQRDRTLFIASSNGAPGQLDDLLSWLGSDERRWSVINGVALISVPDRDPIAIDVADSSALGAQEDVADASTAPWWWLGGGLLAAVALITGWRVLAERRKERTG